MKASGHIKWIAILMVCAALLASGCTGVTVTIHRFTPVAIVTAAPTPIAAADAASAPVAVAFSTPEAAIEAYLDGIAHQDIDAILAASAVDEVAEQFDFQGYVERLQAMPLLTSPAPADYPFYAEMNRIRRQSEILSLVRNFAYSLLSGEVIDGNIIAAPEPDRVRTFVTDIDPSRLAGLELVKIGSPYARSAVQHPLPGKHGEDGRNLRRGRADGTGRAAGV